MQILIISMLIHCGRKDGGCRFYQNALWSEIVQKAKLMSFEEQTEDNRLFSHFC